MFKIVANPTFTHDVKVFTPVDGGHKEESLKVAFNLIDTEKADSFDLRTRAGTTAFLRAIVGKIDGATDERDQPLPWNDELRDALLKLPHVRMALINSYNDAVSKAKLGN